MLEVLLGIGCGAALVSIVSAVFNGGGIISSSEANEVYNEHLGKKYASRFKGFEGSLDSDWYK